VIHGANIKLGKNATDLIRDGQGFLSAGQVKSANERFARAIEEEPSNWQAWFCYAVTGGKSLLERKGACWAYAVVMRLSNGLGSEQAREIRSVVLESIYEHITFPIPSDSSVVNMKLSTKEMSVAHQAYAYEAEECAKLGLMLCPMNPKMHFALARATVTDYKKPVNKGVVSSYITAFKLADPGLAKEIMKYVAEMATHFKKKLGNTSFSVVQKNLKKEFKKLK